MEDYTDWKMDLETGDIILTETGDYEKITDTQTSLAQRLKIRFQTWLGEWDFNTEFGTPYKQRIEKMRTKQEIDAEFRRLALLEEDVTSVGKIVSNYEPNNRTYEIFTMEVYTDYQSLVIQISDPNKRSNIYPPPLGFEGTTICR